MKSLNFALLFLLLISFQSFPNSYWQQKVKYFIEVDIDIRNNKFHGKEDLIYYNNSTDTLKNVFFHLYYNAFQPGSMMDVRSRNLPDPDRRVMDKISNLKGDQIGYHKILYLKQNGENLFYHIEGTILEVKLNYPIFPGDSSNFFLEFDSQIPVQIRRTGRDNKEGIRYSMSQWFPKIAAFDRQGWHANPYIAREFYSPWGDYDVKILIDNKYIVAATGELQNPESIGYGYSSKKIFHNKKNKIQWHFIAKNVHDFVWAADPDYVHDITYVPGGPAIHFFYQSKTNTILNNWKKLQQNIIKAFQFFNERFGKYPYSTYSVIQGGDGGMEYPMATLITGERNFPSLLSVTIHEIMHTWFQMLLATNESYYAWMDEGFASYASALTQYNLFNDIYNLNEINPFIGSYNRYFTINKKGLEESLTTHSDHFSTNAAYGMASYSKGAVFLHQLGYIIGQKKLEKGLKKYYYKWRFKHPDLYDFIRVMENISEIELDWYLDYWIKSTHTIDYSIKDLVSDGNQTVIKLEKIGKMPMPLEIQITLNNGSTKVYYIPITIMRAEKSFKNYKYEIFVLEDWPWVNSNYNFQIDTKLSEIQSIIIDPSLSMADIDRENNVFNNLEKK